jgi:hypothetical protein
VSGWLVPTILVAMVVMVLFVFVPRRLWFVRLGAVLGWAVVWPDNRLTTHWADLAGLAVVLTDVLAWLSAGWRDAARTGE